MAEPLNRSCRTAADLTNPTWGYSSGWDSRGHVNVAVYQPGVRAVAHPGSPIWPDHWALVWWFPGRPIEVELVASAADAERAVQNRGGRIQWQEGGAA